MMTAVASPRRPDPAPPLFVGLDDAARMVGLSRRTLSRWIAAGELPVTRVGRRVLVRPSDLAERVEAREAGADRPAAVSKPEGDA